MISVCEGVLVLDKPSDMTSHDAVNIVRRLYGTKKVGHTGTLDPDATGILVILVGRAAKAAEYLVCDRKSYSAFLRLGVTTDTGDMTGKILTQNEDYPSEDTVLGVCEKFIGKQKQIPPMYSAIKQNGVKLVNLARRGIEVERAPRDIEVFSLTASREDENTYKLDCEVSKGTYIRTLCCDIGSALGCGGTMLSLRRISSGGFGLDGAHTFSELENMTPEQRENMLLPTESLFCDLPQMILPPFFAHLAHNGAEIYQAKTGTAFDIGQRVRMYDSEGFFAIGETIETENGAAVRPIKHFRL